MSLLKPVGSVGSATNKFRRIPIRLGDRGNNSNSNNNVRDNVERYYEIRANSRDAAHVASVDLHSAHSRALPRSRN